MVETYRQFIKRRFREEGGASSLVEAREMLSRFAAEWSGETQGEKRMAHNQNFRTKARNDLTERKKPFSILRAFVNESAANTYTQTTVNTPVNAPQFLAMRIHKIAFELALPDIVTDTRTSTTAVLMTNTATSMTFLNSAGTLAKAALDTVDQAAGAVVDSYANRLPTHWDFGENGILVTDSQLILAVVGTANTGAKDARLVIYYTMESLEPHEYIAAISTFGGST